MYLKCTIEVRVSKLIIYIKAGTESKQLIIQGRELQKVHSLHTRNALKYNYNFYFMFLAINFRP